MSNRNLPPVARAFIAEVSACRTAAEVREWEMRDDVVAQMAEWRRTQPDLYDAVWDEAAVRAFEVGE